MSASAASSPLARRGVQPCALLCVIALAISCGIAYAAPIDFIHAEGTRLVDSQGNDFAVKGINLGNWLVPEGYMFKFKQARSPKEIAGVVETLVGTTEAARFFGRSFATFISPRTISRFSMPPASTPSACRSIGGFLSSPVPTA